LLEGPGDLAGTTGVTGGEGDFAIGGYFAFGDAADYGAEVIEHG
jgi:hypothetical protein